MTWLAVGFALGCVWLQQQATLPSPGVLLLPCAGAAMVLGGVVWARQTSGVAMRRLTAGFVALLAGVVLGFGWAAWRAEQRLAEALPRALECVDLPVELQVDGLPQRTANGVRFGAQIVQGDPALPRHVMLTWFAPASDDAVELARAFAPVRAGERWRLTVRLHRPHGNVNPHGFDFEGWLLQGNWRAVGYVRPADSERLAADPANFAGLIARWRECLRDRIADALPPDAVWRGVIIALALGDQSEIASDQWRLFSATGITHLVSISGLHVTMFAALAHLLVTTVWGAAVRRHPPLARLVAGQSRVIWAAAAGWVAAFAYAMLAGFAVPAQRTIYMLSAAWFALGWRRDAPASRVLAIALLAVLALDPWAVLSAGFWLSFGAVAALLFAGVLTGVTWGARAAAWLRAQWAVTLAGVPMLLGLFQQFSLVSPLANLVAIPLVGMAIAPLALLGLLPGLDQLLSLAHGLFGSLAVWLAWLGALPLAQWQQAAPPLWMTVCALCGAAVMLLPRGTGIAWLGVAGFVPLLTFAPPRPDMGTAHVRVLDVGQGLAVHVQTATHDLLFDAGPTFSADSDSGSRLLAPYLRAEGIRRLDMLLVSHADRDHAGGAVSVASALPVVDVRHSLPDDDAVLAALRAQPRTQALARCAAGQSWRWDEVSFEVMHPPGTAVPRNDNAMSCVLRVQARGQRVMISADIEAADERWLVAQGHDLVADVLVVPHHGSRTSSSPAFIDAVQPRDAIFTVGYRNRFGHPRADVVARYESRGVRTWRSDRDGAIDFMLGDGVPLPVAERSRAPRYWHGR